MKSFSEYCFEQLGSTAYVHEDNVLQNYGHRSLNDFHQRKSGAAHSGSTDLSHDRAFLELTPAASMRHAALFLTWPQALLLWGMYFACTYLILCLPDVSCSWPIFCLVDMDKRNRSTITPGWCWRKVGWVHGCVSLCVPCDTICC